MNARDFTARESYIESAVEGARSIRFLVGLAGGDLVGVDSACDFFVLCSVIAECYISTEVGLPRQRRYVKAMIDEAACRLALRAGDDPGLMLQRLNSQMALNWRSYRRVRSPWRDSSELVKELISHVREESIHRNPELWARVVELALLGLPLGEFMDECFAIEWLAAEPPIPDWWPERPEAFAARVTERRLSKLAPYRNSGLVLENFILNHGPMHRSKVKTLHEHDRLQYYSAMVTALRARITIWLGQNQGQDPA